MGKYILTIDLGTTNIKVCLFDANLHDVAVSSLDVGYSTENGFVEFDPERYWELCKKGVADAIKKSDVNKKDIVSISLTGQAESLVVLDKNLRPLRNGISWMDTRSHKECETLKRNFDISKGYTITGQPDIISTWPITKILWLRNNEPALFKTAQKYLLLKDYIALRLTGKLCGDCTIYNFSYYFDINKKDYWEEILGFAEVSREQLPDLIEPGETAGVLSRSAADELGLSASVTVNIGALDHFAGMIGTGNIREGLLSETTGTVLAIATMVDRPVINEYGIPCHYGAIKDTYVLLPVCESGGICLDWFMKAFLPGKDFEFLNAEIEKTLDRGNEVIFLPYITGTNSPEFDPRARGVFYGITAHDTPIEFGRAVMEGVTYLLQKNIECLEKMNIKTGEIISLGGGSKSAVWNRMKADITGKNMVLPGCEEATSLGAAILAGVAQGWYDSIGQAVENAVTIKKTYTPIMKPYYHDGYKKFLLLYEQLVPVFHG